jgi:protein gp37
MSTREIGAVLGVDHSTIVRDNNGGANAPALLLDPALEAVSDESTGANAPATFNRVNDNIGWARWSWNPVTGCLHNCDYCYARDLAERFYPQKFEPTFLPERLDAPANTNLPKLADDDPAWRRVFTCSMADLFGKWVPEEWIAAVFEAIDQHRQWEYLCLTKFPHRLAQLDWPDNVWAGTTVDKQHRVAVAERAFANVTAGVKWLSCEPLLEPLKFESLEMFDWVVIGASTGSVHAEPVAPEFEWVVDLYEQARRAGCRVYLKHNLFGSNDGRGPGMQPVREWPR